VISFTEWYTTFSTVKTGEHGSCHTNTCSAASMQYLMALSCEWNNYSLTFLGKYWIRTFEKPV